MQFEEMPSKKGRCPVCGNEIVIRSTRGKTPYCSRVCASQSRFATRYRGTMSGPADRPSLIEKTKF